MPLTDTAVWNAKSSEKPRKLFDGGGLFCLVLPSGGKLWRLKYRFYGQERQLSFGPYPEVSLKEARGLRDEARALLRQGIDPSAMRKAMKKGGGVPPLEEAGISAAVLLGDGKVILRKGGAVLPLTRDEAGDLFNLLGNLLGRTPCP